MNKIVLIRTLKTAFAALFSIILAQEIGLEYSAAAGIIAILNVFATRKETLICGDPIKLDQIPERIYIFSGIFYAAFFSLYSIGLKYPNFSFILSLL